MSRRNTKTKENDIERFLLNVAETAENALREYWEERDAENRMNLSGQIHGMRILKMILLQFH